MRWSRDDNSWYQQPCRGCDCTVKSLLKAELVMSIQKTGEMLEMLYWIILQFSVDLKKQFSLIHVHCLCIGHLLFFSSYWKL